MARSRSQKAGRKEAADPLGGWGVLPGRGPMSERAKRQEEITRRNRSIDKRSVFNRPKED